MRSAPGSNRPDSISGRRTLSLMRAESTIPVRKGDEVGGLAVHGQRAVAHHIHVVKQSFHGCKVFGPATRTLSRRLVPAVRFARPRAPRSFLSQPNMPSTPFHPRLRQALPGAGRSSVSIAPIARAMRKKPPLIRRRPLAARRPASHACDYVGVQLLQHRDRELDGVFKVRTACETMMGVDVANRKPDHDAGHAPGWKGGSARRWSSRPSVPPAGRECSAVRPGQAPGAGNAGG